MHSSYLDGFMRCSWGEGSILWGPVEGWPYRIPECILYLCIIVSLHNDPESIMLAGKQQKRPHLLIISSRSGNFRNPLTFGSIWIVKSCSSSFVGLMPKTLQDKKMRQRTPNLPQHISQVLSRHKASVLVVKLVKGCLEIGNMIFRFAKKNWSISGWVLSIL